MGALLSSLSAPIDSKIDAVLNACPELSADLRVHLKTSLKAEINASITSSITFVDTIGTIATASVSVVAIIALALLAAAMALVALADRLQPVLCFVLGGCCVTVLLGGVLVYLVHTKFIIIDRLHTQKQKMQMPRAPHPPQADIKQPIDSGYVAVIHFIIPILRAMSEKAKGPITSLHHTIREQLYGIHAWRMKRLEDEPVDVRRQQWRIEQCLGQIDSLASEINYFLGSTDMLVTVIDNASALMTKLELDHEEGAAA